MYETPISSPRTLYGGYFQAVQGVNYPLHEHNCWELVYYLEGTIECVQDKRHFVTGEGNLWLTPPHTPHAEIARTGYRNIFISVQAPARAPWPTLVPDDPARNLERLCHALVEEIRRELGRDEILIQLMLQELIRRVTRGDHGASPIGNAALVQRAETEFFAGLDQPLAIAEVARRIGASPSNLRLAFQRVRGESPRACLRRMRVQQALHWLQNSTHSLETIASLCGFDSASHLSRVIHQDLGQRPGRLRSAQ